MASLWDRIVTTSKAASAAWRGEPTSTQNSMGMYFGLPKEHIDRINRYQSFWDYYEGKHRKHLKRRMTKDGMGPDDNVTVNISRRIVLKGVSFLFGKPVTWELNELERLPEEDYLDEIWGSPESLMEFLQETAINGGVSGDFYWQIANNLETGGLQVINLDPTIVFPYYNPRDIRDIWAFEMRSMGASPIRTVHTKILNDATGQVSHWETFEEILEGSKWIPYSEPVPWTFPFPMIVHGKNLPKPNSFYGMSDLEDAALNDTLNSITSNLNRITRIYAHPIPWAKGFGTKEIPVDGSKMAQSTMEWAQMGALEMTSQLAAPLEFDRMIYSMISEVSGVPQNDPDRIRIGAQSGFALRVLMSELLSKTDMKRNTYGKAIKETSRRLLLMNNMVENTDLTLHWQDPLPLDENQRTQKDQFELGAKIVSRETISTRRGYDWETEQQRIAEDQMGQLNVGQAMLEGFMAGEQSQTTPNI